MTVRAVFLGLFAAAAICGFTFFNDMVMRGTFLVGNFVPYSVYGTLILFLAVVNPLLRRVGRNAALRASEIAVVVALALCACYIPGRGLLHYFSTALMMPHQHVRTYPGWQGTAPRLSPQDIVDWEALAAALSPPGEAPAAVLRDRLPDDTRARLDAGGEITPEIRAAVIESLNAILDAPDFAGDPRFDGLDLPLHTRRLRRLASPTPEQTRRLNRGIVDTVLDGAVTPRTPTILEHAPPHMLADPSRNPSEALDGFVTGLGEGEQAISVGQVPWYAWRRALLFWVPLILAMAACSIGLALVVHQQWAHHEHLPYPTVEFARALLPEDGMLSAVFRNRLFWIGFGVVFGIHTINYTSAWFPDAMIPVRIRFDFRPLLEVVPVLKDGGPNIIFTPTLYFTAFGFAYFLASDVSLSLGIAPYVYCLVAGILAQYGIALSGGIGAPAPHPSLYAGSFCAMFLVLCYTGRQYYLSAIRRGLGFQASDAIEPHAVFGVRLFAAGFVAFAALLMVAGVDAILAIPYTLGLLVIYVVVSRMLAEAGVFFSHAYFFPCAVLLGFFGEGGINPNQFLAMAIVSAVMVSDPRESLMGFAVTGLRLSDLTGVKVRPVASWGLVAIVIGLAVAIPTTIYLQYQHGAIRAGDGWSVGNVPSMAFRSTTAIRQTLAAQGALEEATQVSGLGHFLKMRPKAEILVPFSVTFVLVVAFSLLRHRFTWWPIHPILFLVLATWQTRTLAFSFLLGWILKSAVSKYGGADLYRRLKPLMIGIVGGELVAGVVPMMIGAIYYFTQHKPPPFFRILPG